MIKVNLLPKEYEKKAAERLKVLAIGLVIGAVVAIIAGSYFLRIAKLTSLEREITEVESELKKLEPVVKKVEQLQKQKAALGNKINVISDLMKSRLLYPVFMEELAEVLTSGVWIESLNTKAAGNSLNFSMSVKARDNYVVADLINSLESAKKFDEVKFSGIATVEAEGLPLRSFSISCGYFPSGEAPKQGSAKKKKGSKRKRRK